MEKLFFRRSLVSAIIILLVGLIFASGISGYDNQTNIKTSQSPRNGLIAYWNFDEGSGATAGDSSGNGFDGDIIGATWTNGFSGFALNFDGESAYVDLDTHTQNIALNKTDNYEVTLYIKTTASTSGDIISFGDSSGMNPGFKLTYNANGTITFNVRRLDCGITLISENTFDNGEWHFVNLIFSGSDTNPTVELYVDENLEDSKTDWVCPFDFNEYIYAKIGRRSNNETLFFDGAIDEVKLYKYGEDLPPTAPDIDGETEIKKGKEYEYTFNSEDPEGSDVYYEIKWGDDQIEEWIGPYDSGEDVKVSHKWNNQGEFEIEARAKDINDNIGQWSTFKITVPKSKSLVFNFYIINWLIEQLPYLSLILRNFI